MNKKQHVDKFLAYHRVVYQELDMLPGDHFWVTVKQDSEIKVMRGPETILHSIANKIFRGDMAITEYLTTAEVHVKLTNGVFRTHVVDTDGKTHKLFRLNES